MSEDSSELESDSEERSRGANFFSYVSKSFGSREFRCAASSASLMTTSWKSLVGSGECCGGRWGAGEAGHGVGGVFVRRRSRGAGSPEEDCCRPEPDLRSLASTTLAGMTLSTSRLADADGKSVERRRARRPKERKEDNIRYGLSKKNVLLGGSRTTTADQRNCV